MGDKSTDASLNLVKQANELFRQGLYADASIVYQKAAKIYGDSHFKANLLLCEKWQQSNPADAGSEHSTKAPPMLVSDGSGLSVEEQLAKTQELLEHYFRESEQYRHKLTDITS